jgi:hypothetical protein
MKVYNGQEDKQERQSKRTTSQLVLATGVNNLVTNGSNKSDFRYLDLIFRMGTQLIQFRISPNKFVACEVWFVCYVQ